MKRRSKSTAAAPRILNQETVAVPVDSIRAHPRNPNQGARPAIRESIEGNGFWGSLIVQRSTGYILAGNHRWEEAKEAGYTELPVTYVDVDDALALRILLADNRTGRLGADDPAALADLLQEIHADAGSLFGTAYTREDLDALLEQLSPEPPGAGGAEDDNYTEQYAVMVVCADEADQAQIYERLRGEGYNCKVVST